MKKIGMFDMQSIEIREGIRIGVADFSRLDTPTLKDVLEQINQILSRRDNPGKLDRETQLLRQIKDAIPASVLRRFKQLQKKQHDGMLSETEQAEITALTDFMEEKSAERIRLMAVLAEIRGVALPELARQLRIQNFYAQA